MAPIQEIRVAAASTLLEPSSLDKTLPWAVLAYFLMGVSHFYYCRVTQASNLDRRIFRSFLGWIFVFFTTTVVLKVYRDHTEDELRSELTAALLTIVYAGYTVFLYRLLLGVWQWWREEEDNDADEPAVQEDEEEGEEAVEDRDSRDPDENSPLLSQDPRRGQGRVEERV